MMRTRVLFLCRSNNLHRNHGWFSIIFGCLKHRWMFFVCPSCQWKKPTELTKRWDVNIVIHIMDPEHASKQLGLNDTLRLFGIDSYLQVFEHGLKRFWKSRLRQVGSTHFTAKTMLTALLPSPIECFRCSFQLWFFFVPGHVAFPI